MGVGNWQRQILQAIDLYPEGFWLNNLLSGQEVGPAYFALHRAAHELGAAGHVVLEKRQVGPGRPSLWILPGPNRFELRPAGFRIVARKVLKSLEWNRYGQCPVCYEFKTHGHAENCELNIALHTR